MQLQKDSSVTLLKTPKLRQFLENGHLLHRYSMTNFFTTWFIKVIPMNWYMNQDVCFSQLHNYDVQIIVIFDWFSVER